MERWSQHLNNLVRPAGVVGLFALIVAGIFYLVDPKLEIYIRPLLAIGVVLVAAFLVGMSAEIRVLMQGRGARYGTNAGIMVVAFVGIVVLANILIMRVNQRWDVTASNQFSLSPQTVKVLQGLTRTITVTAFYSPELSDQAARDLLKEYSNRSERLVYDVVDPLQQPALVNKHNVRQDGSIVLEAGSDKQTVNRVDEQTFTSAILKVTRGQQKKLYMLVGHGEREYNDFRETGFGEAGQALRDDNYVIETLNLVLSSTVPADAAVLVVANPGRALAEVEKAAVADYLRKGGKALFLFESRTPTGLEEVLAEWAVELRDGVVVDPASSLPQDQATPVVQRFNFTDITRDLQLAFFPRTMAISSPVEFGTVITPGRSLDQLISVEPLATSSSRSWLESNPDQAQLNPGEDLPGPLPLAVQVGPAAFLRGEREPESPRRTRIVVYGDADFASNRYLKEYDNRNLLLNTVNWLAEDEDLISIRTKPRDLRRMFLGPLEQNLIIVSSTILLPLAVLVAGVVAWWRRR